MNKCLYFPYSRCLNENSIKKSILLFDEINFLDSEPDFVRRSLIQEDKEEDYELLLANYEYLSGEELVKFINPTEIIKENDLLLTTNVRNDIGDDEFCKIAISESVQIWDILAERLPPSYVGAFYPGAGTFSESISLQALIKTDGRLDDDEITERLKKFATFRFPNLDKEQAWQYFKGRFRYVLGGAGPVELKSYRIPFVQASSLRINEALLISSRENLNLFTDSNTHQKLLENKVKRTAEFINEDGDLKKMLFPELKIKIPKNQLALSILENLVSEENLSNKSIKDVVRYKRENGELFNRFNLKISELSYELEELELSTNYYKNINKILDTKILPDVQKIKDEIQSTYESKFGKLIIQSAGVLIPTLSVSIASGLSFMEILIACSIAELTYLGTKGAGDVNDIIQLSRNKHKNGFSYLLNI